jgi:hypothetical protein
MKTKFLRFNKLPKIDTINNKSPDKLQESGAQLPRDHLASTPIADNLRNADFYDLF